MIFTSSQNDGEHGIIYDRELTGYSYKGTPVELWLSRYSGYDTFDEYSAQIVTCDDKCEELAASGDRKSLYAVLNWARKTIDGQPHVFGETDLRHKKALAAIHGEGAELYIAGYLMLEFGYVVSLASPNMPGYDLLVVNPINGKSCKLQVKFRTSHNSTFKMNGYDFDFLVVVDKPKHTHVTVDAADGSQEFRSVAKFNTWIVNQGDVKSNCETFGYLKNPRKQSYFHNWQEVVGFLS